MLWCIRNSNIEFKFPRTFSSRRILQCLKELTDLWILHKAQGEKKWAAPILDHILQDQSLDHSLVLGQDQDHILERRDTVLGLVPGHIQDLVVEIVCILEIIVEITEIIEE